MAEVIGFLREDATHGEKTTLKLLQDNLPKEYSIYVEIPLRGKRDIRYPDFIVLTNYGVMVLEVKDWISVIGANPNGATIRTRKGEERKVPNPVSTAREFALTLSDELKRKTLVKEIIPWSYAALIANLPYSVITQLQTAWGENFAWGEDDLKNPDRLQKKLRMIFPVERMRSLTKQELDDIRSIIFPVVEIKMADREPFVLDTQQERIVAEPVFTEDTTEVKKAKQEEQAALQDQLFVVAEPVEEEALPVQGERISRNVAIRLVRGFAGSGKTLVLMQRARYLAAQFPDWKILLLTYNKPLQEELQSALSGEDVQVRTFHSICRTLDPQPGGPGKLEDWLDASKFDFPVISELGVKVVERELKWLQDMGISTIENYQQITRHGIGRELRLGAEKRSQILEVYQGYREFLQENNLWDWGELPLSLLDKINNGEVTPNHYDAILIDEAQDWAPSWLRVVSRLLAPQHGLLFLVDDPSQSIYRYFSWREKGIHVVGRTRWLRVPYRNTFEIYTAAYSLIDGHDEIQTSLSEAGELVSPDLDRQEMRHGLKPLVHKARNSADELAYIRDKIDALRAEGFRVEQMAVLAHHRHLDSLKNALRGCQVDISPYYRFKGLEREVIFIPQLHEAFTKEDERSEADERRLYYMAMSRARSRLILTCSGRLSKVFDQLRHQELAEFI